MRSGRYYHKLSDPDKAKIGRLFKEGDTQAMIARRFNVPPATIRGVLRKLMEKKELA